MKRFYGVWLVLFLAWGSLVQAQVPRALPDDPACGRADRVYMARAYELAREAMKEGNAPFAAVLVLDGKVVAEFRNHVAGSKDPTRHAELGLISKFAPKLPREKLARATLYASSEPCVMCSGAIRISGIGEVVYGVTESQFQKIIGHRPEKNPLTCREVMARSGKWVKVRGPLMEKEGLAIHQAYWPAAMKNWSR